MPGGFPDGAAPADRVQLTLARLARNAECALMGDILASPCKIDDLLCIQTTKLGRFRKKYL